MFWMVKAGMGIVDVAGNGEHNIARVFIVIPLELNTTENIAFPTGYDFVFFLEVGNEIGAVLLMDVLNPKVINHKAELDVFGAMLEGYGGDTDRNIPTDGQLCE